jgi:hypothetical protein
MFALLNVYSKEEWKIITTFSPNQLSDIETNKDCQICLPLSLVNRNGLLHNMQRPSQQRPKEESADDHHLHKRKIATTMALVFAAVVRGGGYLLFFYF